jgi:hypothetical protein
MEIFLYSQAQVKDVKQIKILATFCLQIRYNQAINSPKSYE